MSVVQLDQFREPLTQGRAQLPSPPSQRGKSLFLRDHIESLVHVGQGHRALDTAQGTIAWLWRGTVWEPQSSVALEVVAPGPKGARL